MPGTMLGPERKKGNEEDSDSGLQRLTHNSDPRQSKTTTRRETGNALAASLTDLQLFKIKLHEHGLG